MGRKKTYEKLVMGIQEGLHYGKVNGQSFQPLIDKGHTLTTVLQEYVVCGGSKGNMLNMLDENFDTEDFFSERFCNPYRRCICGKRDLAENVYITLFDPSTSTGVNENNPILAIGNHCQTYFPTLQQKQTEYINQQNKQENQSDGRDSSTDQMMKSLDQEYSDAEEDSEEEVSEYVPTESDFYSSQDEEDEEEEEEEEEEDDAEEKGDEYDDELQPEEYQDIPTNCVTKLTRSPPPPAPAPAPNIFYTLHSFSDTEEPVLQQDAYTLEEIRPLLSCSKSQETNLQKQKRRLYQKLEKYQRKIAKVHSKLQRFDNIS
jgi:hypothetical protein